MTCKVLYETWQMQCCGKPFSVGDTVEWLVEKSPEDLRKPRQIPNIEYFYEAHSSEWRKLMVLTGEVSDILIHYEKFEDGKPVDEKLQGSTSVDGYEDAIGVFKASAYIVGIIDGRVRPARKEEVKFE